MTVYLAHAGIMDYAHGQLWQWDNEGIQQMFFDTLSGPVISEQHVQQPILTSTVHVNPDPLHTIVTAIRDGL